MLPEVKAVITFHDIRAIKYTEVPSTLQQPFTDQVKNIFCGDCDPENVSDVACRKI